MMYGIEKEWRGKVLKKFRLKPGVAIKNPVPIVECFRILLWNYFF